MPVEVIMPKVDMDMASGKIVAWHVAEGDSVSKGDPLFDIETDKAAMEVEAPADGILHHTTAEGTGVPIGEAVAWLYSKDEKVGDAPSRNTAPAPAAEPAAEEAPAPEPETEPAAEQGSGQEKAATLSATAAQHTSDKTRATPLARSLARQHGVDLSTVVGSGPQGRVQAKDIREAPAQDAPAFATAPPVHFTAETGPLAVSRNKGGTGMPVVLIHGFAGDALGWAPLEAHLKDRPLIRIELPCHGKSPKLRVSDFAALAKTIRTAFDGLNVEAAHVIGHSLGGALALALADTRPKSIASLTLLAPAGLGPEVNGAALTGLCNATRPASLGPWLKTLVADDRLITDSYVRLAMAAREDPQMRAAQAAMADVLFPDGVQAFDLRAALDRIDMPARIIWGKRDDILPWRHALHAPGHIALHLFDGIGHIPQFEAVDEVGKILKTSL